MGRRHTCTDSEEETSHYKKTPNFFPNFILQSGRVKIQEIKEVFN
jgi:hypothetical protein